jgi:hypothetical protein
MEPLLSSWHPGKRITAQRSSSEMVSGYMLRYAAANFFTTLLVTWHGSQAPAIVKQPPTLKFGLVRNEFHKASLTKSDSCHQYFVTGGLL